MSRAAVISDQAIGNGNVRGSVEIRRTRDSETIARSGRRNARVLIRLRKVGSRAGDMVVSEMRNIGIGSG